MCDTQVEKPYRHVRDRDECWNGQDVGSYLEKVLEDGLENQAENPEVQVDQGYTNPSLAAHKVKLQSLAGQLRSAYRGLDIEWWDESGKAMSEEGSGAGGLYDDEDYAEGSGAATAVAGSGDDEDLYDDDDLVVPTWHKDRKQTKWDPFQRSTTSTTTTTSTTSRPVVTAGAAPMRSRLTAARTIMTFMLPVMTYYIGSFYTTLPFLFS